MPPNREDYRLATLLRMDPEKLAAFRRVVSGVTRCPKCDEPNKADQKYCNRCGALLYPDLEEEEEDEAKDKERK